MYLSVSLSLWCCKAVGKFHFVVRLDVFYGKGEGFHQMVYKYGRGIGAVFFKSLYKIPSGILIKSGILEEMLSGNLAVDEAGRGDELHIYLDALAKVGYLLVRLYFIGFFWLFRRE